MTDSQQNAYQIAFDQAKDPQTRESFWEEQSKLVDWHVKPKTILCQQNPNPGLWRWFKDGKLNISYNCLDRWIKAGHGDIPAIHWYSGYLEQEKTITYNELHQQVCKLASVYKNLGIKKGDRIIIYMPMIPEAIVSMLACARIGAIHSVVFGGFSAFELSGRIQDCKPSLIMTSSCGLEPNKVIDYKKILDEALSLCKELNDNIKVILYQRSYQYTTHLKQGRDLDYQTCQILGDQNFQECEFVEGDHPLYILYTSGTTGQPKGIVRDSGGTAVATSWTMKYINNIKQGDVFFSGSDIGWVVGHHFTVYGPLLMGATTVMFEGKPNVPNSGIYWKIIEKYKVNALYTAPTALRAIRKDDQNGDQIKKYNLQSLKIVNMAGERCDVPTYEWINSQLNVFINDNYWQTEVGWIISCNYKNLHTFPLKPGSAIKPAPGFVVEILDQNNKVQETGKLGKLCIKLPMPPSFMLTLYNNEEAFQNKYLKECPGYYFSGDCGYFDHDGYLNVMTRLDDIINTAGHRLSTAAIEEALLHHQDVVEAAVVAKNDNFKGEIPFGFVVLKNNIVNQKIELECVNLIRKLIGPVACFRNCLVVERLPKTRSGKIIRNCLKKMVDAEQITRIPPTIEDASVLENIWKSLDNYGAFKQEKDEQNENALVFRDKLDQIQDDGMEQLIKEES